MKTILNAAIISIALAFSGCGEPQLVDEETNEVFIDEETGEAWTIE